MLLKTMFILVLYTKEITPKCLVRKNCFSCQGNNIDALYKEIHKEEFSQDLPSVTEIEILGSNIPTIDYIIKLPILGNITYLAIKMCKISYIREYAFDDFSQIKTLDLGYNEIEEMSFVETLPITLTTLLLNNNAITFIITQFSNLKNLQTLDLSYNNIKMIEFGKILSLAEINLSNNEIYSIIPQQDMMLNELAAVNLNLSNNKLSEYNETNFFSLIDRLDLSFNVLKFLQLKFDKRFISLAYCTIEKYSGNIHSKVADLTAVNGIQHVNIKADELILTKNHLGDLSHRDIREYFSYDPILNLDLSNSSVTFIPDNYFVGIRHCSLLNLSYNDIITLPRFAFRNSVIETLDLTHSNLEMLKVSSLSNNSFKLLDLSHNNIATFARAFHNSTIEQINLSYNPIEILPKGSFRYIFNLKHLILTDCRIEEIDSLVFTRLYSLDILDLRNNTIKELGTLLHGLPVRNLSLTGNQISTIKEYDFSNLHNIISLDLSYSNIKNMGSRSFMNLSKLTEINLSNNKIETVVEDLFYGMPNLKKINLSKNPIKSLNRFSNNLPIQDLVISFKGTFQPNQIANFNIKTLTIKESIIDSLKSDTFKGLYSLTHLYFNDSSVYFVEKGALNDLFNLQYLDSLLFKYTKIMKQGMFQDLEEIETLDFSGLTLDSIRAESFTGLINMKVLMLNNNKIGGLVQDSFLGLISLQALDLNNNKINDLELGVFNGLKELKILFLAHNNIQAIPIGVFVDLEQLEILELQNNQLQVLENNCFKGISKILEINLATNNLQEIKKGVFQNFTELRNLRLQHNNLGSFQHLFKYGVLSNLKKLEVLDLSYNNFTAMEVKTTFCSLKALTKLNLDYNNLQNFDFQVLLSNCRNLMTVGISFNRWRCEYLADIVEILYDNNVNYAPDTPVFDADNIEGINCTDVCKIVFCEGQDPEIVQRQ